MIIYWWQCITRVLLNYLSVSYPTPQFDHGTGSGPGNGRSGQKLFSNWWRTRGTRLTLWQCRMNIWDPPHYLINRLANERVHNPVNRITCDRIRSSMDVDHRFLVRQAININKNHQFKFVDLEDHSRISRDQIERKIDRILLQVFPDWMSQKHQMRAIKAHNDNYRFVYPLFDFLEITWRHLLSLVVRVWESPNLQCEPGHP